jgi:hypothetical protein
MKNVFVIVCLLSILFFSCDSQSKDNQETLSSDLVNNPISADDNAPVTDGLPVFSVSQNVHDFGTIIQGEKVSHIYKFKNTGKSDLIVSSVRASCGCTVPTYSKDPVKPGGEGEIEIVFDSSGRLGRQHKTITVLTNSQPNSVELSFTAEVLVPEE